MSEMLAAFLRSKTKVDGNIFISKEKYQFVTAHGGSVCGNDINPFRTGSGRFRPVYQRFNTRTAADSPVFSANTVSVFAKKTSG